MITGVIHCSSGPPTACRNLRVNVDRTRANSIRIEWERPLITGRDDYYYNVHYSDPDQPGNFIQHNHNPFVTISPLVGYSVSGLSPLTNYTILVTVENGVSDQAIGEQFQRSCEVTATTGDIRTYVIRYNIITSGGMSNFSEIYSYFSKTS